MSGYKINLKLNDEQILFIITFRNGISVDYIINDIPSGLEELVLLNNYVYNILKSPGFMYISKTDWSISSYQNIADSQDKEINKLFLNLIEKINETLN